MKKTIKPKHVLRLVLCACVPLLLAAAANCEKPTDANLCYPDQGENCENGCVKISGDDSTKHKDCEGNDSAKKCDEDPSGGSAGGTKWVYNKVMVNAKCSSCGTTIENGPDASSGTCRTATASATDCGT